jgi:hypothetical protein
MSFQQDIGGVEPLEDVFLTRNGLYEHHQTTLSEDGTNRRTSQKRSRFAGHYSPMSSGCDFEMVFDTALDNLLRPSGG